MSNRQFAALKADIARNGIITPLDVVKYKGQVYVVNGNHRLMAARQLGMNAVLEK